MLELLVSFAFAGDPLPCRDVDPPALAVVLWDRRDPTPSFLGVRLGAPLGDRQMDMSDGMLDALFGLHGVLEAGDRLSIIPQGIDPDAPGAEQLRAKRGTAADVYQRLKMALPGPHDPVRPVNLVVPAGDARGTVARAVQERIIEPMLAPCDGCADIRERTADRTAIRAVSEPWLLTHHALASAYVDQGFDETCAEPDTIYLMWVSPQSQAAYDAASVESEVQSAFGDLAVRWLWALDEAYYLEPMQHAGHIQMWRVHRGAARPSRGAGAALAWTDSDGVPASLVRGTTWRGGFEAMAAPIWGVSVPPTWTPHSGTATLRWQSRTGPGEEDEPIAADGGRVVLADPDHLRATLLAGARGELDAQRSTFDPELATRLRLLPPADALFGWSPVAILEARKVTPPRIRLSYVPVPWWTLGVLGGGVGFVALGALQQVFARTRRRRLAIDLAWERGDDVIDLMTMRDRTEIVESFGLRLADASGYWPRRASLDVRLSLRTFLQPEVPLRDADRATFQRLAGAGWATVDEGLGAHAVGPNDPGLRGLSAQITTRHAAIDFARVEKDDLVVVHAIRVQVHDRTGRYVDTDETVFRPVHLKAVPGPAEPRAVLEIAPSCLSRWLEVRLIGLSDDEWRGARVVDVGWLVIENPVRQLYTPLPVVFRVAKARAWAIPEDAGRGSRSEPPGERSQVDIRLILRDSAGARPLDDGLSLGAGERRSLIATLELPEAMRDLDRTRWNVTIEVELAANDGSAEPPAIAPCVRSFRVRSAGRSRSMVLDFGTGATRLLLQDLDEERWGFLPMHGGDADLGGSLFVGTDGTVAFGVEADDRLARGEAGQHVDSLKALLLRDGGPDARAVGLLRAAVHGLMAAWYAPIAAPDAEVAGVRWGDRLPLSGGPRAQLVALVPNEASPAWVEALRDAFRTCLAWSGSLSVLCEAEAAALWYASVVYGAPPAELPEPPPRLRLLVLDIGAGTTDAALVDIDRQPAAGRARLEVVATGGAGIAGRALDDALFEALCLSEGRSYVLSELPAADQIAARCAIEDAKRRMSSGELHRDLLVRVDGVAMVAPLDRLATSPAWNRALDRVAREALTVLVGRLGTSRHPLAGTHLVVLTGRGSLSAGLVDRVERAVADLGVEPGRVHRVETRFLKESVSLGARLYALGLTGDFVPSEQCFRDRIALVYRRPFGRVYAKELLPSGVPFRGGPIVGEWTEIPRFEQGRLVRTWLRPVDRDRAEAWELDPRGMIAILQGEPVEAFRHTPTAVPLFLPLPWPVERVRFEHGAIDDLRAMVRAVVHLDGRVEIEGKDR